MCPWQSPMRVWHFQELRLVERETEANRASWNDLHAGANSRGRNMISY